MKAPVLALIGAICFLSGCSSAGPPRPGGQIEYVGSSTVAIFLGDAQPIYGALRFQIDTQPESAGGEEAIVAGRTEFAGIANTPQPETLQAGVQAALIGRDAIAVIVNARNPMTGLSLSALSRVFGGEISNWNEIGGPDLELRPFIVGKGSATREAFRKVVLGEAAYAGCEEIEPDAAIVAAVAAEAGGIGQISFSFLERGMGVRTLAVDGEQPSVVNFDYPVSRPLYLLWRAGNPALDAFIAWSQSIEGQNAVMRHFVGRRVLGSVSGHELLSPKGTLVVYTETYAHYDGGIYYYPHRPYDILRREGTLVRHVLNHRGENDEEPMRIALAPGTYLIRAETTSAEPVEFLVTIEAGRRTDLDVAELLHAGR